MRKIADRRIGRGTQMRKVKRFVSLIIAALCLFSLAACTGNKPIPAEESENPTEATDITETAAPEETPVPTEEPFVFDPETDVDNRFAKAGSASFLEFADYDIFQFGYSEGPVYYWDKTTNEVGVLCNKPECDHTGGDCLGNTANLSALSRYEGRLYWLSFPYSENGQDYYSVYSMKLDSSDRREEYRFEIEKPGFFPSGMYVHRGMVFLISYCSAVENGAPYYEKSVEVMKLGNNERKTVYDIKTTGSAQIFVQFRGNNAYILTSKGTDDDALAVYLTKYNIVSDVSVTSEYRIDRPDMWIGDCYLTQEGELLIAMFTDYEAYPGGVYRIEENGIEELFALEDGEYMYDVFFGDGVVCGIALLRSNPTAYLLWITDLEGNTIFKGEQPMEFRNCLSEASKTNGRHLLVGSGTSLFIMADESLQQGGSAVFLVKYDFSSEGLIETDIGSYITHPLNQ